MAEQRHSPAGAAFTALLLEVFRLNGRLLAAGDGLTADLGLTSARWQVLGAIENEPLSVAQIARAMGLARQSVQRLADLLAAEGIVAYRDNPEHRRAKLVELTPLGRRRLDRLNRRQTAWANAIARGIPAAELKSAHRVLQTLGAALDRAAREG
jgi:DNA-binding MarR family transcriptional regulator